MNMNERVIHNSGRYVASLIGSGLVVQSHQNGAEKYMPRFHSQYADYVTAIETAIDEKEADTLCAALLR
jgi:hypothetical protein